MPSGASWMFLLPGSPCPAQAFLAPEPGRQPLLLTSLCQRPDCVLGLGWGRTGCFLSLQDIVTLLACDHSFQGLILFLNWAQCQDFNRSSAQTGLCKLSLQALWPRSGASWGLGQGCLCLPVVSKPAPFPHTDREALPHPSAAQVQRQGCRCTFFSACHWLEHATAPSTRCRRGRQTLRDAGPHAGNQGSSVALTLFTAWGRGYYLIPQRMGHEPQERPGLIQGHRAELGHHQAHLPQAQHPTPHHRPPLHTP